MRINILLLLGSLVLLAGCSSHNTLPDFTASGYLADRGAVRIWRKNYQDTVHMLTVYTPFSDADVEQTEFTWQHNHLMSLERHIKGAKPDDVTLRFDSDGKLSFMQRQLAGHRESLSDDEVALYQFDVRRMLQISDALLSGRVVLHQGYWQPDNTVTSCQNQKVTPAFDNHARQIIRRLQGNQHSPVSIAWLEASQGTQLLLVTPQDLCASEPEEKNF
ncbi:hypothetical protein BL250_14705 [Erwinia sp. OLTSP20]|uniref:DUF1481 domain-containing protein n=1 Tax=unclassified Erwinia TaxID=2622719 RepID=UPI000C1803EB|nr:MULTISPECIES: DUF1481 domain-containing protein [unclassified Erwinia]PIJ48640.1 hypothetical protein BV501_16425 [Erwinia sp. OAMSP11]PIJ66891.1 hypothetical protein BK416_17255 [Erwinia sp. OLSSP12]PIJ79003.1 hypothetical protein BLD47_15990 [Erwinia sp. OLCASP19]PIJ79870.1 hypothetical protein BLD46_16500 [Erwinia sp. OLMTSP26]PIJ81816.1 hypothetical protein BLD49_16125 [Erwinia sp. OLMDSP33]